MTGRLSNRELFCAVLMEMCEDQSLDGISVSGLCKRAGVSRQTFYTYFSDIKHLVCYAGSRPLLVTPGIRRFNHKTILQTRANGHHTVFHADESGSLVPDSSKEVLALVH